MRRRTFLGVLAFGWFAGCADSDGADVEGTYTVNEDPFVRPPTETAGPGGTPRGPATTWGDGAPIDVLRARLDRIGITVLSIERSGPTATLTYETAASSDAQLRKEMRAVGLAYARAVERGLSVETLHVVVVESGGTSRGSYYIRDRWTRMYLSRPVIPEVYIDLIDATFRDDGTPRTVSRR